MTTQAELSPRDWTLLRAPRAGASLTSIDALRVNGAFRSPVKLAADSAGAPLLRAEIPPFPGNREWIALAEEEMALFEAAPAVPAPADVSHLPAAMVDRLFVLADEAGFAAEIRPGGETCLPLRVPGREVLVRGVGGHPALCLPALPALPEAAACSEAVRAYALAVSAQVRLVRASLLAGGGIHWEVPLPDAPPAALVADALGALATVARGAARELEDLAVHPILASTWMRHTKKKANR